MFRKKKPQRGQSQSGLVQIKEFFEISFLYKHNRVKYFWPYYTPFLNENVRDCNCNYILFTKLPWPGDSEGTFRSSSQAASCPPVYHTRRKLHTVPLIAERQAGKLWIPVFIVFGLTRPGIEPEFTASVADALSTRPLIGSRLCWTLVRNGVLEDTFWSPWPRRSSLWLWPRGLKSSKIALSWAWGQHYFLMVKNL